MSRITRTHLTLLSLLVVGKTYSVGDVKRIAEQHRFRPHASIDALIAALNQSGHVAYGYLDSGQAAIRVEPPKPVTGGLF